jgi:hypothetical protein
LINALRFWVSVGPGSTQLTVTAVPFVSSARLREIDSIETNSAQPLEAADGKPVQKRLFVGKVAKRRSMAYA